MAKFDPVNSMKARCTWDDLKHGDLVWCVTIEHKTDKLDIFPARVVNRHDFRDTKGLWTIGFRLKWPEIKGLRVHWWGAWLTPDCMFETKEDALIAAEAYTREQRKEDADFLEKYAVTDEHWDDDDPTKPAKEPETHGHTDYN